MNVNEIPRTIVRNGLQVGRLPISTVEQVLNRNGNTEEWPPLLAYDTAAAAVKLVTGTVLRDDELVAEARLQQARVAQLRKAAELEAEAQAKRAEAERQHQQRIQQDEQRRQQVEQQAAERERKLEQERAAKERQAREAARKKEEAAKQRQQVAESLVEKRERAARKTRVQEEREALTEERRAAQAAGDVVDLTDEIERSKQARRARAQ